MTVLSPHYVEIGCSLGSLILLLATAISLHKVNFGSIKDAKTAKHISDARRITKGLSIVVAILIAACGYLMYTQNQKIAVPADNMQKILTAIRLCNIASVILVLLALNQAMKINKGAIVGASARHLRNAKRAGTGYLIVMVLCYMYKVGKSTCATSQPSSWNYIGGNYY